MMQSKGPPGSFRGESSGSSPGQSSLKHQSNGGTQERSTEGALNFLKAVKTVYKDQIETYNTFLEVLKDFNAQRIKLDGLQARVKELFRGHNSLISMFNVYLPDGHGISITEEEEVKPAVDFGEVPRYKIVCEKCKTTWYPIPAHRLG